MAIEYIARKFKEGISHGGHLAITYRGELLYLRISLLSMFGMFCLSRVDLITHAFRLLRCKHDAKISCANRAK